MKNEGGSQRDTTLTESSRRKLRPQRKTELHGQIKKKSKVPRAVLHASAGRYEELRGIPNPTIIGSG